MQTANAQPADDDADSRRAGVDAPTEAAPMSTDHAAERLESDPLTNLALIRDIEVKLSMEIGHTRISIDKLLSLAPGSVIELDRMADEPLDVLVNGTLVARGEAVVVGDRFGIRLVEVVSPAARLGKLA